ncbi:hypothetical protein FGO68_gene9544 [Halteria grandinella]|uniref:Uncharacterized protein n=1 Tax=Halteria grandinella TaxID=5974 RepID=A0A8J8SUH2_HALGN|nr:hypothetical protein FGO68_gene9544 [Halteria grandinella]
MPRKPRQQKGVTSELLTKQLWQPHFARYRAIRSFKRICQEFRHDPFCAPYPSQSLHLRVSRNFLSHHCLPMGPLNFAQVLFFIMHCPR